MKPFINIVIFNIYFASEKIPETEIVIDEEISKQVLKKTLKHKTADVVRKY